MTFFCMMWKVPSIFLEGVTCTIFTIHHECKVKGVADKYDMPTCSGNGWVFEIAQLYIYSSFIVSFRPSLKPGYLYDADETFTKGPEKSTFCASKLGTCPSKFSENTFLRWYFPGMLETIIRPKHTATLPQNLRKKPGQMFLPLEPSIRTFPRTRGFPNMFSRQPASSISVCKGWKKTTLFGACQSKNTRKFEGA